LRDILEAEKVVVKNTTEYNMDCKENIQKMKTFPSTADE